MLAWNLIILVVPIVYTETALKDDVVFEDISAQNHIHLGTIYFTDEDIDNIIQK